MVRSYILKMQVDRCIGAAKCFGRKPADVLLQALHTEVSMQRRIPDEVWGLGDSP